MQAPLLGRAEPCRPDLLGLTIAGAALVQASHAAVYGFSSLHWQQLGYSGAATGGLWAAGIAGEALFFCFVGYLIRGPAAAAGMLAMSAAVAALRWIGMAFDPDMAGLIVLQLAHGVTFGATHLCSVFLLARFAPPNRQAQAQAWLAAGWAGAMALLTSLSGALYASWGENVYLLMTATAVLGLCLLVPVAISVARARPLWGVAAGDA
jgi:PPP family 3-phenylpropionic acid transporter